MGFEGRVTSASLSRDRPHADTLIRKPFHGIVKPAQIALKGCDRPASVTEQDLRFLAAEKWFQKQPPSDVQARAVRDLMVEYRYRLQAISALVEQFPEGDAKRALQGLLNGKLLAVKL